MNNESIIHFVLGTSGTKFSNEVKELFRITPCYCAGGSVRSILDDSDIHDYDFFFGSEESLIKMKMHLNNYGKCIFECPNNTFTSYMYCGHKIQLIHFKFYSSAAELIRSFDFTICQFVYDGINITTSNIALKDLINKRLRLNVLTFPAATIKRIEKYTRYGFKAHSSLYSQIVLLIKENHPLIEDFELVYVD